VLLLIRFRDTAVESPQLVQKFSNATVNRLFMFQSNSDTDVMHMLVCM